MAELLSSTVLSHFQFAGLLRCLKEKAQERDLAVIREETAGSRRPTWLVPLADHGIGPGYLKQMNARCEALFVRRAADALAAMAYGGKETSRSGLHGWKAALMQRPSP